MTSVPMDIRNEKMKVLMKKLGLHLLTRDEATEFIPLLEEEQKEAVKYSNKEYHRILSELLEVLRRYLAGEINLYMTS
jgi:Glu-tRNA(Gln) amidotransferase subunit E-like FAD-binding protein